MNKELQIHKEAVTTLTSLEVLRELKEETGTNNLDGRIELLTHRYNDLKHKLYSPDFSKTENLWQALNGLRLILKTGKGVDEDTLNIISETLNDNRP